MADVVHGIVDALRDNGIRIVGGEWYSFSKFGKAKNVPRPQKGDDVEIECDDKGFIQKLTIAGDERPSPARGDGQVDIHFAARLAALTAALQIQPFPGFKRSLQIADAFTRWLIGDLDPDSISDLPGRRAGPDASPPPAEETAPNGMGLATPDQRRAIKNLQTVTGRPVEEPPPSFSFDEAAALVRELNQEIRDRKAARHD